MKRFEIAFDYEASYVNTVEAPSLQEALTRVMDDVYAKKGFTHVEPKQATIHIREVPFLPGERRVK